MSLESWFQKQNISWVIVSQAFNHNTKEANLWVQDKPGLQRDFYDSQCYTKKLCLKKQNKQAKEAEYLK